MKRNIKQFKNNSQPSLRGTKQSIQLLLLLLLLFTGKLAAQQQNDPTAITQEIDYKIDNYGDAQMELRQKMTASQWQNFKASPIAANPSIFKRNLERSMATVQLEDIKNQMNDDTRSSVTQIKALNMATYKGDGKWELKLAGKNPNVTKISDHVYLLANNLIAGGGIIQQLQKIFFPENATDIKQDTNTYGDAIFTYVLNVEESSSNYFLLFLGIALLLAGAAWQFVPRILRK